MKKLFANKNVLTVCLAIVVGILFIIFGFLGDDSGNKVESSSPEYTSEAIESYTASLEKKVAKHIEMINGVSNVSVLLTVDTSTEKVYATDGAGEGYVIIKDSSGNESALQISEINTRVRGIAVICDYGKNEEVRQQIIQMLSSLFSVGTNRISVISA